MISRDFITEWRAFAPWISDAQVEQDLVISRAVVEMFRVPEISNRLAFRGGTALHKLYLGPAARFSDDIDLVQTDAEPIGSTLDAIRQALDQFLGEPKRVFKEGRVNLIYRFAAEGEPPASLRLKVEINTREHFSALGLVKRRFEVQNRWFSGAADINTYRIEEMLGTKLRALYQRKKGRDLYDLWTAGRIMRVDAGGLVECFRRYLDQDGLSVSRAEFERNLHEKLNDPVFIRDIKPLIKPGADWDLAAAADYLFTTILPLLPGEPWRGSAGKEE